MKLHPTRKYLYEFRKQLNIFCMKIVRRTRNFNNAVTGYKVCV